MLTGFIEATVFAGFKLRFAAENLNRDTERRERRFYAPDRNGVLAERQVGYFRPGLWWSLTLSGSF
jgi:hypothetical protein